MKDLQKRVKFCRFAVKPSTSADGSIAFHICYGFNQTFDFAYAHIVQKLTYSYINYNCAMDLSGFPEVITSRIPEKKSKYLNYWISDMRKKDK